jgi:hypothetical protein
MDGMPPAASARRLAVQQLRHPSADFLGRWFKVSSPVDAGDLDGHDSLADPFGRSVL